MSMRRLGRALGSAALDMSTGGLGSLAMKIGRDAAPKSQAKSMAHPREQAFSEVVDQLIQERGEERTCFLLTQALHDVMDSG